MPGFGGEIGEGEAGTQRRRGDRGGQTPQGLTGTWVQADEGKGGGVPSRETAVDTGTLCGAQGQAEEAGKWWVHATYRWATLCTGRVGGEWVKNKRA